MRNREDILKATEKSSSLRRVSGGGRPCLLDKPVVTRLLEFVAKRRAAFQPVTARMLYYEWVKVNPDAAQLSESAAKARIYRFMRRNDLVVRRTTHHAQNLCKTYGIEKECIANFDETDVHFAVETRSTIAYRGEKTVSVKKPDSSSRCTIILGCSADGEKFPPYIIYKGKRGARVAKELRKSEEKGYSSHCRYTVQPKAWIDEGVMLDWIDKVWKPFATAKKEEGKLTLLIVDQMSAHTITSVCDIGLNKPFKDYMRGTVHEWLIDSEDTSTKPDRQTVSHWIEHAWNKISSSTITNTWAHIKLVERAAIVEEEEEEEVLEDSFLSNDDPREEDVLALHDSMETSDEED
eukprot:scaffold13947_cov113-Amphora_coffeaeformis.AAC.2